MFAGLIFATEEAIDAPGGLRATLPIAGATLIEAQARRLVAAGAGRLFVLTARVAPELSAAVDRIARRGIAVELVRRPAELAERLRPDEPVMALAEGTLAAPALLRLVAAAPQPPALLVTRATGTGAIERIDADDHWAGVALVDAVLLESTLAMLGEWNLQSTLLRRAVHAGAARRHVPGEADASEHAVVATTAEARRVDAVRLARSGAGDDEPDGAWLETQAARWIGRPVAALLADRAVPEPALPGVAAGLAVVGLAGLASGWPASGAALLLLAIVTAICAGVLARQREDTRLPPRLALACAVTALAAIPAAALGVATDRPVLLPLASLAALLIGWRARAQRLRWAPSPLAAGGWLLAGALAGNVALGIAGLGLHATAALAMAIERLRAGEKG